MAVSTSQTNSAETAAPVLDLLGARDWHQDLIDDVRHGLTQPQKSLPPKWFYDAYGSELFEQITREPEYYPTEAERSILLTNAMDILMLSGADTLVELGSGISDKTTALLDALVATGGHTYMPFDVSADALQDAMAVLGKQYPTLEISGVIGDFDRHLSKIPVVGRRMIAFLGGTIGNYSPGPRRKLLAEISSTMRDGDTFLLGTDLVKDAARLEAAYNDEAGITAQFNKNVLTVLNRQLDADCNLDQFTHLAYWDADNEWISIHVQSDCVQSIRIPNIGDDGSDFIVDLAQGETIHTEISAKFTMQRLTADLASAGLSLLDTWTDGDFLVSLSRRV